MTQLHARLVSEQVDLGLSNGIWVELTPQLMEELYTGVEQERRLKVGVDVPMGLHLSFAELEPAGLTKNATVYRYGGVRRVGDDLVWSMAVNAPGATGMRLHLTGLEGRHPQE